MKHHKEIPKNRPGALVMNGVIEKNCQYSNIIIRCNEGEASDKFSQPDPVETVMDGVMFVLWYLEITFWQYTIFEFKIAPTSNSYNSKSFQPILVFFFST